MNRPDIEGIQARHDKLKNGGEVVDVIDRLIECSADIGVLLPYVTHLEQEVKLLREVVKADGLHVAAVIAGTSEAVQVFTEKRNAAHAALADFEANPAREGE